MFLLYINSSTLYIIFDKHVWFKFRERDIYYLLLSCGKRDNNVAAAEKLKKVI